jgi:DNA invertase Pin-like site-specific DNA recombinase
MQTSTETPKRAAIYLRLSKKGKDEDGDGESLAIERQRKACRNLCKAREWEIVTEYVDDNVSASKSRDAAEFGRMIEGARAGSFDVVVAYAADRIARRLSDIETLINTGVQAATVQGDLDLTTPEGEGQASILVTFARMEARQKSVRQKAQGLQAAQDGEPRKTRIRPFGYERDGVTIREPEAAALRQAYKDLLAGTSLVSITKTLAAQFQTPAGKPFHRSATRAILLNPRNAAIRTYWYQEVGPAKWPEIIDIDTFRDAQKLLTDPTRRKNQSTGTARRWLLGGLALCGRCGSDVKVNYRRDVDHDGNAVRVYRCRASGHLSRVADWCDWRVSERVIARLSQPDARDLLVDNQREDMSELRQEEAALRMRLDQLGEDFADGMITRETLRSGTERLRTRLADLEARMSHVDRAPLLADLVTAEDVRAAWEGIGLDRQRAVIDLLYTVTLMPRPPGRFPTSLDSVQMTPRV